MTTVETHYPKFVQILEAMRADNSRIHLDTIEQELAKLTEEELETIAAGDRDEAKAILTQMPNVTWRALETILVAAFDG